MVTAAAVKQDARQFSGLTVGGPIAWISYEIVSGQSLRTFLTVNGPVESFKEGWVGQWCIH